MPIGLLPRFNVRFLTLRYFNEVARLGSIRKAADRLHVAPSAVSRQIAQLELEVDAVLFERSKNGVQLTVAGEVLARHSHRIFRDLDRARAGIDDLRGLRRGEVSIWVIEGFMVSMLPGILADFRLQYPGVTFRVQTGSTDRIIEAILQDEADIGMTFNAVPRGELETVVEHVEPVQCMLAASHEYADRTSLTLEEICKYPLALPDASFGLRQSFDHVVAERNLNQNVFVTTNSLLMTRAMAGTGQVIAFMPALTVMPEVASGELRVIPVSDFTLARSSVVVHRDRPLSHAAQAFLKTLTAAIRGLSVEPR